MIDEGGEWGRRTENETRPKERSNERAFPLPHLMTPIVISFGPEVLSQNHSFPSRLIAINFLLQLIINLIR